MIEIRITDPTNESPDTLRAVADFLVSFADAQGNLPARSAHLERAAAGVRAAVAAIAPADNPAAGVNLAEVFGHGSTALNADAAKLEALAGPGAAGINLAEVFGGNVQAAALQVASAAAVASVPVPNTNHVPLDLDADGLPWDARIHSNGRAKIQAGTWKEKRGVDDATKAQVIAELRGVLGTPSPVAQPVPLPPVPAVPTPPALVIDLPGSAVPNVPVPPAPTPSNVSPPASVGATPPAVPSAAGMTFPQFCVKVTTAINAGQLTKETLDAVLVAHGLSSLPTLAPFPHLVGPVAAALGFA